MNVPFFCKVSVAREGPLVVCQEPIGAITAVLAPGREQQPTNDTEQKEANQMIARCVFITANFA